MRHLAALGLVRHVTVELLIDDRHFETRECPRIPEVLAQAAVIEQILPPDVGADQGKIAPCHPDLGRQSLLQRPHRALARRRCALRVHDDRLRLRRQPPIALRFDRAHEMRLDEGADHFAAVLVARHAGGNRSKQRRVAPEAAMLREDNRHDPAQRTVHDPAQRLLHGLRSASPFPQHPLLALSVGLDAAWRLPPRGEPAQETGDATAPRLGHMRRRSVQQRCKLCLDEGPNLPPESVVCGDDLAHVRIDVPRENRVRHPAEVDAEVLDLGAVGHREVRRHANQQFVHHQPPRPENDQLLGRKPRQIAQFAELVEAREDVLRPEDGRERQQTGRQRGRYAGMPGAVFGQIGRCRKRHADAVADRCLQLTASADRRRASAVRRAPGRASDSRCNPSHRRRSRSTDRPRSGVRASAAAPAGPDWR